MKRIKKTHPPKLLRQWIEECSDEPNFSYKAGLNSLPAVKAELLEQLIAEQHYLCAYAGVRIEVESCHIEHLKPQNKCEKGEDVAYENMVACFPEDGGDVSHGFGAPVKAGWWEPKLFVTPLSEDCERRFSFAWSGGVDAASDSDQAAKTTIKRLGLDCGTLQKLRRAAIAGFFQFKKGSKGLSLAEAERLHEKIDKPGTDKKLRPFCFVLKQLLRRHISALKKSAKGKK